MDLYIDIPKEDVLLEVERLSSLAGAEAGDVDRFWASEDDRPLLEGYWAQACCAATGLFMRWLRTPSCHGGEDSFRAGLDLPDNASDFLHASLAAQTKQYLASLVLAAWLGGKDAQAAARFQAAAAGCEAGIRRKLLLRLPPFQDRAACAPQEDNVTIQQYEERECPAGCRHRPAQERNPE